MTNTGSSIAILASNTSESAYVVRRAGIVYKFLRPAKYFETHPNWKLRMSRDDWLSEVRRRVEASHRWPLLNPLLFCESLNVVVSRFVAGRRPSADELQSVCNATDRLGIGDVSPENCRITASGPVVIDWVMR